MEKLASRQDCQEVQIKIKNKKGRIQDGTMICW